MNLLITGHTGFLGSALARAFTDAGHRVTGVGRQPSPNSPVDSLTWDDLELPGALDGYDLVIHLAGIAGEASDKDNAADYRITNVDLTAKIYNKYLTSNAPSFIFFSSVKAVSGGAPGPVTEQTLPLPAGAYGRSKRLAEEYLLSHLPEPGRHVWILRPCMVHGPGMKGNLPRLFRYVRKGLPIPVPANVNQRHYLALDNLIFLMNALAEASLSSPPQSGIYHLSDDDTISFTSMLRLAGEAAGRTPILLPLPAGLLNALTTLGTLLHLPFNRQTAGKLFGNLIVPNRHIMDALCIDRLPVRTEEGFRKTFRYLQDDLTVK